ncbi:MAG TPA: carbohydrate ABC transporter permease [Candidatus Limnocylindria bacterium]|nr:carbohydrate ABC transporter permease [Candidatus Limnocylindria bacterium]
MTASTARVGLPPNRRPIRPRRVALYAFLTFMTVTWLFPLLWAAYTALRPYGETLSNGYISLPSVLNLDNFVNAWERANFPQFYLNSLIVAVPSVLLTLLLASMVAFAVSRFSWRFNLVCLMLFTAGNLLPPQVIIVPLYRLYLLLPIPPPLSDNGLLYDQYLGIIIIHVAFQTGFCVFVLSNYMKTLSRELTEAALADGAPVWRIYWNVILPLCRPALAALATLEFTFIYNDFFWALLLMKSGDRRPITSALNNLQGQFFTDTNVLAAGALLAAIPTILVYIALQRHFISGLTLGATKG